MPLGMQYMVIMFYKRTLHQNKLTYIIALRNNESEHITNDIRSLRMQ